MAENNTKQRILLIDQDQEVVDLLQSRLVTEGFDVEAAPDGLAGLQAARAVRPAAVIIGRLLSDMRGEYVCRELKTHRLTAPVPVIMLCGAPRGGPRVGSVWPRADVYIAKFFGAEEIVAKLHGQLRLQADRAAAPVIYGPFKLNRYHATIHLEGKLLDLSVTEYKLLALLLEKHGRVVPRQDLLRDVWGYNGQRKSRTSDIHIHRVRTKLRDYARLLETIHGVGYRLRSEALW